MKDEDVRWMAKIIEKSHWLFYGEFEEYLNTFLKIVFQKELKDYGFDESLPNDFQVAYWAVLSEMDRIGLVDYGTSPRGAWLTENGERFMSIIKDNENALRDAQEYIYNQYN